MKFSCNNLKELKDSIKDLGIKMVDLRFIDIPGTMQHFTIPIKQLSEDIFLNGLGFDGSSIRGFQKIENSDMIVIPDITTTYLDPFTSEKINPDRQSCVSSPESSTKLPSPAGTTDPVNENAKTVVPLADTVNPLVVASPPEAPVTHPLCENWNPAISTAAT